METRGKSTPIEIAGRWWEVSRHALPVATVALAIATLYGAFFYAAREKVMGDVQRIFYFHAPAGIVCFLAFFVTFVAGIGYLATRKPIWDIVGHASAEVGLLFCSIVLMTGPLWARPIWGTYWTWEARLTTTLILWLIYIGYLLVRRYTDNSEQRARFAAVVGIVGFLDVPIVYWSVSWWRGHHPLVLKVSGGGGLEPSMKTVFGMGVVTYLVLYATLLAVRIPLGRAQEELNVLRERHEAARRRAPARGARVS
ncbi:MAG TPA: cytochrome c biogenesis protein CcsA [Candidatus Polarisedimenticolia bacterium]|nr:cytochrome c biogenesis protein CcsA [Candidatus Polarisedimenticolia bacterium]